jgi:endonuclease-3
MAAVQPEMLEREIQSTGFFRNKTKSLIGAAKKIIADHDGEVPATMEELLALPGVARKTANVVLGSWFGKATGVVVDTHVQRISNRLDLTKNKWVLFSHQIIHHGRAICVARKPRCVQCSLEDLCYAPDKTV